MLQVEISSTVNTECIWNTCKCTHTAKHLNKFTLFKSHKSNVPMFMGIFKMLVSYRLQFKQQKI